MFGRRFARKELKTVTKVQRQTLLGQFETTNLGYIFLAQGLSLTIELIPRRFF